MGWRFDESGEHGFTVRQVGYWIRRLTKAPLAPALLPVRVAPVAIAPVDVFRLPSEHDSALSLPRNVPASWPAGFMRAL